MEVSELFRKSRYLYTNETIILFYDYCSMGPICWWRALKIELCIDGLCLKQSLSNT
jgi:hypothetical protein